MADKRQASQKPDRTNLVIGVDFDNTIIDYGTLFYKAGTLRGIVPTTTDFNKKTIRDYLVSIGKENDWTRIQGIVYGKYIDEALVMKGFSEFLLKCHKKNWIMYIISHKTRYPVVGERFDLHVAALNWLEKNNIYNAKIPGAIKDVFFEETRSGKIRRINELGCNIIIDDLLEILHHPDLSSNIFRILFNPDRTMIPDPGYPVTTRWDQIYNIIEMHYG